MIFNYCEGNTTLKEAASLEEFAADLRQVSTWKQLRATTQPGLTPAMARP